MGWVIGIRPERIAEYKALHAAAWPEILAMISACGIRNYTIYLREPENLLFAHYEYHGKDFQADMARMAQDAATQRWWALTAPCQQPLATQGEGEWWSPMEEVFHHD
jgi:L-rhamnose mutarotase